MSLQAVTAVAIHAGTFRNIDLPHQGLYHLRCSLHRYRDGNFSHAVPHILPPERDVDARALLPAKVVAGGRAFQTKSVFIRFSDEEAVLDDIVQFLIERDHGSSLALCLQLEMKLMYADLCDGELPVGHLDNQGSNLQRPPALKLFEADFHELSTKTFRLHGTSENMHAYCPCVFEDNYFCHVGLMVHSTLLDFRLRLSPPDLALSPYARPASKVSKAPTTDVAACGWCTRRDAGTAADSPRATSNGVRPPSLADDLVHLAGLSVREGCAAPCEEESASGAALNGSEDVCDPRLASAVDLIMHKYVGKLSEARQALIGFVQSMKSYRTGVPEPHVCNGARSPVQPRSPVPIVMPAEVGGTSGSDLKFKQFTYPGQTNGAAVGGRGSSPVPISKRFGACLSASVAAMRLAEDLSFSSSQVLEVWMALLGALSYVREDVTDQLYKGWEKEMMKCWSEHVFREVHPVSEVDAASNGLHLREERGRAAAELRALQSRGPPQRSTIEDSTKSVRPVLFEQRYTEDGHLENGRVIARFDQLTARTDGSTFAASSSTGTPRSARARRGSSYLGIHIFVLVHGFQGCSFDMRLIKSSVSSLFPTALCLCSEANEDNTEGDIDLMGQKLAQEVSAFIREWCTGGLASGSSKSSPRGPTLGRLSFICHSVGGLIARSALPLLCADFGHCFHTFLSFSSPHLGYLYAPNSLFKTGLWLVSKVRQSTCLEQLSMTDADQLENCYLLSLSRKKGLSEFRHVVLLASHQDQYAPFESARLEMCAAAKRDGRFGKVYAEMLQNILGPLKPDRIIRFDIDFGIKEVSLDSVIGRAAHIQFIESQELMQMLIHMYPFLFE